MRNGIVYININMGIELYIHTAVCGNRAVLY